MPRSTKINFTHGRLNDFSCPADKKVAFYWDAGVHGLGVRATAGSRSYIFQGNLPGTVKFRMTIGSVDGLALDEARKIAQSHAAKVAKGIDPRQEKIEKAVAAEAERARMSRQATTLAEAWPTYLEAKKRQWSPRYLLDHQRLIEPGGRTAKRSGKGEKTKPGALAALRDIRLNDITGEVVRAWLEKEAATRPTQARLALCILKAFLNWCSDHPFYKEMVDSEVCSGRIKREVLPPKKARNDCLQREQLRVWFGAVRQMQNRVASAYLQGLLLTGARRGELASLEWENIDFQWRALTIHDKVEGERTIPLTPYLAELLNMLPRSFKRKDGISQSRYVFGSPTSASGYLQDPRRLHNRACKSVGIDGLTLHGLRRSFGTLSEWVEAPVGVVAQIMGHKPSAIAEKHYRRRPLDLLRLWHVKIEKWILDEAGIPQPAQDAEVGELRAIK